MACASLGAPAAKAQAKVDKSWYHLKITSCQGHLQLGIFRVCDVSMGWVEKICAWLVHFKNITHYVHLDSIETHSYSTWHIASSWCAFIVWVVDNMQHCCNDTLPCGKRSVYICKSFASCKILCLQNNIVNITTF